MFLGWMSPSARKENGRSCRLATPVLGGEMREFYAGHVAFECRAPEAFPEPRAGGGAPAHLAAVALH
jgi:hypothetical protein